MAEIKVKRSSVAGKIPAVLDLALGEFAINTHDGLVFIKKNVAGTESIVTINSDNGGSTELQKRYSYTATSNQTVFVAEYTAPYVDVYQNGAKLGVDDYTATNGTSVTLASGAITGDLIEIIGHKTFGVASVTVDGGSAASVYLISQTLDGGGA
jgi:hypothetical protein